MNSIEATKQMADVLVRVSKIAKYTQSLALQSNVLPSEKKLLALQMMCLAVSAKAGVAEKLVWETRKRTRKYTALKTSK